MRTAGWVGGRGGIGSPSSWCDAAVAREQDRALLVTTAVQLEKQVRRVGFEWQIAELIDDQELGFGEMSQPLLEPSFAMSFGQLCNERGRGGELHRIPGQDRFAGDVHRIEWFLKFSTRSERVAQLPALHRPVVSLSSCSADRRPGRKTKITSAPAGEERAPTGSLRRG
jgi:hypothetical protein